MTIKELFEGPVEDFCIARNTIKCLLFFDYSPLGYSIEFSITD